MSSANAFKAAICSSVMGSPSSFSASASAIQSRRHVRNLKSEEKRVDISLDAYRSVRGFDAESRFTNELYSAWCGTASPTRPRLDVGRVLNPFAARCGTGSQLVHSSMWDGFSTRPRLDAGPVLQP